MTPDATGRMENVTADTTYYRIFAGAADESTGATLAQVTDTTKIAAITNSAASAVDGDSYTYPYGIGVAPTQKVATYTGNVVCTLAQQLGS